MSQKCHGTTRQTREAQSSNMLRSMAAKLLDISMGASEAITVNTRGNHQHNCLLMAATTVTFTVPMVATTIASCIHHISFIDPVKLTSSSSL